MNPAPPVMTYVLRLLSPCSLAGVERAGYAEGNAVTGAPLHLRI